MTMNTGTVVYCSSLPVVVVVALRIGLSVARPATVSVHAKVSQGHDET